MLLLGSSCKTKHKVTERESVKTDVKTEEKQSTEKHNYINIDSAYSKINKTLLSLSRFKYGFTQADSSKTIIIEDSKGNKLKVKGADISIFKEKKEETIIDTSFGQLIKTDKSVLKTNTTIKTDKKEKTKQRKTDSYTKTTSTWFWVFVIVAVVAAYFLVEKTK